MKLFGFQPKGHGEYSFFTTAETKEEAIEKIWKKIRETEEKSKAGTLVSDTEHPYSFTFGSYEYGGFPEKYNCIEGDVLMNPND